MKLYFLSMMWSEWLSLSWAMVDASPLTTKERKRKTKNNTGHMTLAYILIRAGFADMVQCAVWSNHVSEVKCSWHSSSFTSQHCFIQISHHWIERILTQNSGNRTMHTQAFWALMLMVTTERKKHKAYTTSTLKQRVK